MAASGQQAQLTTTKTPFKKEAARAAIRAASESYIHTLNGKYGEEEARLRREHASDVAHRESQLRIQIKELQDRAAQEKTQHSQRLEKQIEELRSELENEKRGATKMGLRVGAEQSNTTDAAADTPKTLGAAKGHGVSAPVEIPKTDNKQPTSKFTALNTSSASGNANGNEHQKFPLNLPCYHVWRPDTPHHCTTARPIYDIEPMTSAQKGSLREKLKSLKQTASAEPFAQPVDIAKFTIPTYPIVIKDPMDLGTMEEKLRLNMYYSVQRFAEDFYLIIRNCRLFNGDADIITRQAFVLEKDFLEMMRTVPSVYNKTPLSAYNDTPPKLVLGKRPASSMS